MCECIQTMGRPKTHQPGCEEGFPNKPHKHAALIKAWADGAEIETKSYICDASWAPCPAPTWSLVKQYRIKPEPKPDVVWQARGFILNGRLEVATRTRGVQYHEQNIKFTFDGETNQLKSVELIK